MKTQDRGMGCLFGLAVGDALGTTLEFTKPGSFEPLEDMVGGGPFQLEAGQWTDDTSMALCLAESLIVCEGFNAKDQCERYLRWWQEGYLSSNGRCFDIGSTVKSGLSAYRYTGEEFSGNASPHSAGNGSIMRLAPVPMFYQTLTDAIHFSRESSRTTHQAETVLSACEYLGAVLWSLMNGHSKDEVLSSGFAHAVGLTPHPRIAEVAEGSFKERNPPQIQGSGYVVESLEAALWAFYHSENFRHGALLAVNLGRDADTTGAIYGQMGGALYGMSGIPASWSEKIAKRDQIESFAKQLLGNLIQPREGKMETAPFAWLRRISKAVRSGHSL